MIKIKNLCKSYGQGQSKIDVLKNIDLEIEDGKIICILGPSGSGKSTLLNIIGGIETIDSGQVDIYGENLSNMTKKDLESYRRDKLGFVFQFYNLISDLNVLENIELGKYLAKNPLDIDKLVEDLGIKDQLYKYPNEISGGQAQRTSIARALIKSPQILICDEPTGALDYESAKDVLNLIEKMNKEYKSTILIASHNVQISKMCDYILKIHDGKVKSYLKNDEKILAKDVTW
ncbi:ABC transporter ATP-binding protein [Anaerococcus sp. NML200574]|uniref:ABC transporter ATP-binding protein n=1 Tax=Anaerococcus kampingae TaxID=3115614 RepID=A0ABW9ME98_9FIRM|nr:MULTISPECIES: ABC transporter ATP-binding protein [unclassified Anaerococcus]MCW6678743.1 ABC transporter ATP-binding protein [Anaerococcus sp. NML200574]